MGIGLRRATAVSLVCACVALAGLTRADDSPPGTLRVCADPDSMPQSNTNGEGYENRIAARLASDLGRQLQYTFFPQRMGFVRNTLRMKDESTNQYKCDLIIGVPKGYELTATTQPYMHSTYAIVLPSGGKLAAVQSPDDLLKLAPEQLHALKVGAFAGSPGVDWLLRNKMVDQGVFYTRQSGDVHENPALIVERDLTAGTIDLAVVWGPIAGYLASRHGGTNGWRTIAFRPDPAITFDYEISMGVRFGEKEWKDTLDAWIAGHRGEINAILTSYGIPLVDNGNLIAPAAKDSTM
jgi:quinoprotein dehydrogenase-associated probable ABC transporter substrate-binding protein